MEKQESEKRVVFLSGKKVDLVIIEKSDLKKIMQWVNDPEVTQFIAISTPMSLTKEEKWLESISESTTEIVLGIATKKGELIGNTGLHNINWKDRHTIHGIVIGDKNHWSGGYGTEAGLLLFKYGFGSLGLNKINSSVIDYNERSLRYHIGCGFKVVGKRKQQFFKKGKFHDEIIVELFPKDFEKVWNKYQTF